MKRFGFLMVGFFVVFGMSGCSADNIQTLPLKVPFDASKVIKNTFCTQDEKIVFSCRLENKKTVSLCGKDKQLRYSYGKYGQTAELNMKGGNDIFKAGQHRYMGATILSYVGFKNDIYRYSIFQVDGTGIGEVGIVVEKLNNQKQYRTVFRNKCMDNFLFDNFKNSWTVGLTYYDLSKDNDIDENGLDY